MARPAFSRWASARRVAGGSSGSTASASDGYADGDQHCRVPAGRRTRATATPTVVTAAAPNRETASTNQPIFSRSPVLTATISPAATRRVMAEPSSVVLRASSCCIRATAVIQLVTAARCSMRAAERDQQDAQQARTGRRPGPVGRRRGPPTACTARPTGSGNEAMAPTFTSPQARALSLPAELLSVEPQQEGAARTDVRDARVGMRKVANVHDVPGEVVVRWAADGHVPAGGMPLSPVSSRRRRSWKIGPRPGRFQTVFPLWPCDSDDRAGTAGGGRALNGRRPGGATMGACEQRAVRCGRRRWPRRGWFFWRAAAAVRAAAGTGDGRRTVRARGGARAARPAGRRATTHLKDVPGVGTALRSRIPAALPAGRRRLRQGRGLRRRHRRPLRQGRQGVGPQGELGGAQRPPRLDGGPSRRATSAAPSESSR